MNEKQVALDQILALIAEVAPTGQPLRTPSQDTVAAAYDGYRTLHGIIHHEVQDQPQAVNSSLTQVCLSGWGVRNETSFVLLPLPPHPQPLTATVLDVPALNAFLRTVRPDRNAAYPDEYGVLQRDGAGRPISLDLLGRVWVVLAELECGPAMEVSANLGLVEFQRAASAALDALDAHQN